jgi:hypothetical protein
LDDPQGEAKIVEIQQRNDYLELRINVGITLSRQELGRRLGLEIVAIRPQYEALVDSYLAEITYDQDTYNEHLLRMDKIRSSLPQEYQDEIEGMAEVFTGTSNVRGDGKLSKDEVFLVNLVPDVVRNNQCSMVSVYGERSASDSTITARILDWYAGSMGQLVGLQTVTTFVQGEKSFATIGYLGFLGVITGINDQNVYAAILDSQTGATYSATDKRSYPFDIRYALENFETIDAVAAYLQAPANQYATGHLVVLSDQSTTKVLENNVSGAIDSLRVLRTATSELNDGIIWDIPNAIGAVNSFVAKGNYDNHTINDYNWQRWVKIKLQLIPKGDEVTLDEMKSIITYYGGAQPGSQWDGDLYNESTQQIILCQPQGLEFDIFFKPVNGTPVLTPSFQKVFIQF